MKNVILKSTLACIAGALLSFCPVPTARADADDKPAAPVGPPRVKQNADGEMVVTVDAATQKRIKLEVANPTVATWQPELKAYGRVIDPTPLETMVLDLTTAKLAAEGSRKEFERTKTLASQTNASPRALEAAQLASDHAQLDVESMKAKFSGDWQGLASLDDSATFIKPLADRKNSLVKLILPAGEQLTAPPAAAALTVFPNDNELIPAKLIELNLGVDPQTQGQMLLCVVENRWLPVNAAVTGHLSLAGQPANGVMVPSAAVLRHEGLGWVYVQTADDEFTRRQIPLDHLMESGWFVPSGLSVTNKVVSGGAETVLSAELSGGAFNTGTRD